LEVNPHYLHLKEKLDREMEQARLALIQAKEELKTAKRERELRRKSSPALSEEEQDALVRESQYQKAELKRLERGWKERIKTLEEEVITFETEIETEATFGSLAAKVIRTVPYTECERRNKRLMYYL